jgi:hypothetical protein
MNYCVPFANTWVHPQFLVESVMLIFLIFCVVYFCFLYTLIIGLFAFDKTRFDGIFFWNENCTRIDKFKVQYKLYTPRYLPHVLMFLEPTHDRRIYRSVRYNRPSPPAKLASYNPRAATQHRQNVPHNAGWPPNHLAPGQTQTASGYNPPVIILLVYSNYG